MVAVYILWGSTYLAIRVAVESFPPLLLGAFRFILAGSVLYPFAVRRSGTRPTRPQWIAGAVVGILLLAGGNGAVIWAEQFIASGLAALLIATVPMWMVLFDWALDPTKRPSVALVAGIAVALVGVSLLTRPGDAAAPDVWPVVVVLLGSVSWAAGSIWSRTARQAADPLVSAAVQMISGGTVLGLVGTASGELARLELAGITPEATWAFVWLVGGGSLVGFTAYGYALQTLPTSTVATYAFVNPVVAVGLGWLLLGEQLDGAGFLGGLLVVASVALIVRRRSKGPTAVDSGSVRDRSVDGSTADRRRPDVPSAWWTGRRSGPAGGMPASTLRVLPVRPHDSGYLLRPARPDDRESIERLLAAVGLVPPGGDHLASTVVIWNRGDVVGCGTLEQQSRGALLRSLAVHPDHQGAGVGATLVRSLILRASRASTGCLWLFTETADGWFSRFGFLAVPWSSLPRGLIAADEARQRFGEAAIPMVLELPRRSAAERPSGSGGLSRSSSCA